MKKHIGSIMAVVVIAIAVALALLMNSCSTHSVEGRTYESVLIARARLDSMACVARQDTAKWNAFLECSKYEGDAGCDSCFTMIYGYSLEER